MTMMWPGPHEEDYEELTDRYIKEVEIGWEYEDRLVAVDPTSRQIRRSQRWYDKEGANQY